MFLNSTVASTGSRRAVAEITEERPLLAELRQRAVVEVAGPPLSPGAHQLELAMRVVGFGDALVRVREAVAD